MARRSLATVAGDRSALLGLLLYLVVATAPALLFWIALRLIPAVATAVHERRSARRAAPGPSLQAVVADLRRLRRELRGTPARTRVRRVALLGAYDDTVLEVCRLVGLDAPPLATAVGTDRAFARLLTEATLEQAGIALDPPRDDTAAA